MSRHNPLAIVLRSTYVEFQLYRLRHLILVLLICLSRQIRASIDLFPALHTRLGCETAFAQHCVPSTLSWTSRYHRLGLFKHSNWCSRLTGLEFRCRWLPGCLLSSCSLSLFSFLSSFLLCFGFAFLFVLFILFQLLSYCREWQFWILCGQGLVSVWRGSGSDASS